MLELRHRREARPEASSGRSPSFQSGGMKSHAVFADGSGMPGVSGELKLSGPPMSARLAKLPGFVPWARLDGLPPRGGSSRRSGSGSDRIVGHARSFASSAERRGPKSVLDSCRKSLPYARLNEFRFQGFDLRLGVRSGHPQAPQWPEAITWPRAQQRRAGLQLRRSSTRSWRKARAAARASFGVRACVTKWPILRRARGSRFP